MTVTTKQCVLLNPRFSEPPYAFLCLFKSGIDFYCRLKVRQSLITLAQMFIGLPTHDKTRRIIRLQL